MWASVPIVLVVVVSTVSPLTSDLLEDHQFTNLASRLNDHSWNQKKSTLLGIGQTNTCSTIFSCADCNTAQVCRPTTGGTFIPVRNITCPGTAPYCQYSTGTCATEPDDSCGQTDDFVCLADGSYPDANCSVYHVCDNLTPHKFECLISGETYNADQKACTANGGCGKFSCDGTGMKVANSLYPSYYAYCTSNAELPLVIDRCVGIYQLNATSQQCEPICEVEGLLQDVEDCTKYYKCTYLWIDDTTKFMTRQRMDCPTNTGFDPTDFMCVNLTTSNCKTGVSVREMYQLNGN